MTEIKQLMETIDKLTLHEGRYWEKQGEHEKEAQELMKLVEPSGPSKTLRGELMRAVSKIYYDYYNNGFGNTWEGPATLLMKHVHFDSKIERMFYEHGGGITGEGFDELIEAMMSSVVEEIYEMDDSPNTVDMWKVSYDSRRFQDDEYDETDDWSADDYDDAEEEDNYDDFKSLARGR
tara:strand:+ start:31 stop:564 length:534 start_codon:yes stop_codon:yes gene_type:complete